MTTRAERKAAAEARRKEWRLRWAAIVRGGLVAGKSTRDALHLAAVDAARMAIEQPQRATEIERAVAEFARRLAEGVKAIN